VFSEQQERGDLDGLMKKEKESIFLQSPPGIWSWKREPGSIHSDVSVLLGEKKQNASPNNLEPNTCKSPSYDFLVYSGWIFRERLNLTAFGHFMKSNRAAQIKS